MITPRAHTTVSRRVRIVTAIAAAAALAACASSRRPVAWDAPDAALDRPSTIRFDNEGEQSVDVYLVGERREWRLGRVAPGQDAKLAIPLAALTERAGLVRLAVIGGGPMTVDAARDPRAQFSIAQPVSELPLQRFAFWQRQLGAPQLVARRADAARP